MVKSDFRPEVEMWKYDRSRIRNENMQYTLIYGRIAKIYANSI